MDRTYRLHCSSGRNKYIRKDDTNIIQWWTELTIYIIHHIMQWHVGTNKWKDDKHFVMMERTYPLYCSPQYAVACRNKYMKRLCKHYIMMDRTYMLHFHHIMQWQEHIYEKMTQTGIIYNDRTYTLHCSPCILCSGRKKCLHKMKRWHKSALYSDGQNLRPTLFTTLCSGRNKHIKDDTNTI